MKNRVLALQKGDLDSKIEILGTDELAELSITFNKLISDIKNLIDEKHRVLLDVSHELKTPLTRMKLLLEMMPDHIKKTELKLEINFLNDVISNLLLSDKLDIPYSKLNLKKLEFCSFIKSVLVGFDTGKVILETGSIKSLYLYLDETKINIALRNIIQNALKYDLSEKQIIVSLSIENNNLYITIRDFGPGVDPLDVEKIFTPFFRSEKTDHFSGVGLGLSIAKKIMKSHKGNIIFNNKIKKSSEFILSVPLKIKND
jgi:signal transduction histidine kinase